MIMLHGALLAKVHAPGGENAAKEKLNLRALSGLSGSRNQ
jgi:hypothetical protein